MADFNAASADTIEELELKIEKLTRDSINGGKGVMRDRILELEIENNTLKQGLLHLEMEIVSLREEKENLLAKVKNFVSDYEASCDPVSGTREETS